jgi:hypothetical protein
MRQTLLIAAAFIVVFIGVIWAGHPQGDGCPAPSSRSVTDLFAPCLDRQAANWPSPATDAAN